MASKKGFTSQKNIKGGSYRSSYWNHKKEKPTSVAYKEKVRKHYARKENGCRNADRINRMENALLHDTFAYVFPRNMLRDPAVRRETLKLLREIIRSYKRFNILYVPNGKAPESAVSFPTNPRLFLVRERYGMPYLDFLLCLKGDDDFVSDDEKFKALSDWTGIPAEKMEGIDLAAIAPFFREKAIIRNASKDEEWGFLRSDSFSVWNIHAKTVNINR